MTSLFRWAAALLILLTLLPARRANAQTWTSATPIGLGNTFVAGRFFYPTASSATDAAGNIYLTGRYKGTYTLGAITLTGGSAGGADAFVAKLSPAGQWLWAVSTQIATTSLSNCIGYGISLTSTGDVLVTGSFSGNVVMGTTSLGPTGALDLNLFVAQLNGTTGAWQWVRGATLPTTGSGNSIVGSGVGADAAGNVYVGGTLLGSVTLGAIPLSSLNPSGQPVPEAFVARLSPAGAWTWATASSGSLLGNPTTFPPPTTTTVERVLVDAAGNTTLAGRFGQDITFGAFALARTDRTAVTEDFYVSSVSPTGVWRWATHADTPAGRSSIFDLALAPTGAVVVTGGFWGTTTFGATTLTGNPAPNSAGFLATLAANGQWQWAVNTNGGPAITASTGNRVTADAAGNILVGGGASPPVFGQLQWPQSYVARYSPTGTEEWRTAINLRGRRCLFGWIGLDPTAPNEVRALGVLRDTAVFGPFVVGASDSLSVVMARLNTLPLSTPADHLTTALTLTPNPAHETVQLTGAPAADPIALLDALGRTVRTYPAAATTLDVRGLTPGLYSVRAGSAVQRLVVE